MSIEMDQQRQPKQQQLEWRRGTILELSSQGRTEREIASILRIGKSTVNRDLVFRKYYGRGMINLLIVPPMLPVQMNSYLIVGMATMLTLTLVAAMTTITAAYADNFAGQVTSQAAKELRQSGSNFGAHTSDPTGLGPNTPTGTNEHGRNGLANALTERGEPQHPSEVIRTICGLVEDAPGCP